MTPSELRAGAQRIEQLCVAGSRGARNVACEDCKRYAGKLRQFAELIAYGRMTIAIDEAVKCEVLQERARRLKEKAASV